jgi:hypothetical protein
MKKMETKTTEVTFEYQNSEQITFDEKKNLIFNNFDLLQQKITVIKQNPEMNLYNPKIFIFGGIPAKEVSVYLGIMLKAWNAGLFTENCECGNTSFIYSCGGSLLSGNAGWRYSYCPFCKKHYNHKNRGGITKLYQEAKLLMNRNENIRVICKVQQIPVILQNGKEIRHPIASTVREEEIKSPVETLSLNEIVQRLKSEG